MSHHWQEPSTELWEEEEGTSIYTRLAQWRALKEGTDFARLMNDEGAARWYKEQAALIFADLSRHWDQEVGYLRVTIDHTKPRPEKSSGLDVATILAILHTGPESGAWSVLDDRVQATVQHLEEAFIALTLQSLVTQTVLPSKIVVVNDNSSDATSDIVLDFIGL